LQPGVIMASPLGRALQTAVIAYGPLAKASEAHEMILAPNAKEKQNFGGLDTVCTKMGEEILLSTQEELRSLYADQTKDAYVADLFKQLRFDLEEVQERWWSDGQAESTKQLEARLDEFMYQLLFMPKASVVVFGHSLFFQQLVRKFLSEDMRTSEFGQQLCKQKLSNCGVLRLDMDPSRMLDGPFLKAQLVLGTELVASESFSMNCCAASSDRQDELRPDDVMSHQALGLPSSPLPNESRDEEPIVPQALSPSAVNEPASVLAAEQNEDDKVVEVIKKPAVSTEPAKPAMSAKATNKCCPF